MRFKEFLILEGDIDSGSDYWFYGNGAYPSNAPDWGYQIVSPSDFLFLQGRWKKERDEWKRKFYNINVQDTLNKKFTCLKSNTMPEVGPGFWRHSEKDRPNIEVDNDAKLELMGISKSAKIPTTLHKSNPLLDKTEDLNRIFGDFKPSYNELPVNFDKNWSPYSGEVKMKYSQKKKYSKHLNNF